MMITVDPSELIAAAETLRSCAREAADVGTQLWSCAECSMPADLQGVVDQLVVAADRALDSVAAQLDARAVDLTNRASIAINDSLVAATGSTTLDGTWTTITVGGNVTPVESLFGGTMTIGGANPDPLTITASPFDTMIVSGPTANVDAFGEIKIGNWLDDMTHPTANVDAFGEIKIGNWLGDMTHPTANGSAAMMFAASSQRLAEQNQAAINAIVSNPNSSPYALRVAHSAQDGIGYATQHILASSKQDYFNKFGYYPTDSQLGSWDPYALPDPNTSILFP